MGLEDLLTNQARKSKDPRVTLLRRAIRSSEDKNYVTTAQQRLYRDYFVHGAQREINTIMLETYGIRNSKSTVEANNAMIHFDVS